MTVYIKIEATKPGDIATWSISYSEVMSVVKKSCRYKDLNWG